MKELNAVKATVDNAPDPQARAFFLDRWFRSPAGLHFGADPVRRGAFARDAGFTSAELGRWNCTRHGINPPDA